MTDKRELILARLVALAAGVTGVANAYRNADEVTEAQRPAVVVYDADEAASSADLGRGRPSATVRRIAMTPQVFILLTGKPAGVGTALNGIRAALISAIQSDATLQAIVGPNGSIAYDGFSTTLSRGRAVEAEGALSFTFNYILNPADLAA